MTCALCRGEMEVLRIKSVTLDRCRRCSALWFDQSELAAVLGREAPVLPLASTPDSTRGGQTPTCRRHGTVRLDAGRAGGATVWQCPRCQGLLVPAEAWDRLAGGMATRAMHGATISDVVSGVLQILGDLMA